MKSHPFSLAVRAELSRRFANEAFGYHEVKLQQADIRDPLCLCYAPSKAHRSWVLLGCDKERPTWLRAFAGRTTKGLAYGKLRFIWLGDRPFPAGGMFDALDVSQYAEEAVPFDGSCGLRIEIEGPSADLQETVAAAYLESPEFQSWLDRVMPFEQRKKVPPTRDEVAVESGKAERIYMRQWTHLLERNPTAVSELSAYLVQPVGDLIAHVSANAIPMLNRLLAK